MTEESVEAVAHAVCLAMGDGDCQKCSLSQKGPNGGVRGCIYDATKIARAAIAAMPAQPSRNEVIEQYAKVAEHVMKYRTPVDRDGSVAVDFAAGAAAVATAIRAHPADGRPVPDDGWMPIATAPEGDLVLCYCPAAHSGIPSCEVLMVFHGGDQIHQSGRSYWTNGGPNGGSDLNFDADEEPTHWRALPAPPVEQG